MKLQLARDSPKIVKSISAHSPVPFNTRFKTSIAGYSSNIRSNPAEHEGASSGGRCCSQICLPAKLAPISEDKQAIAVKICCHGLRQLEINARRKAPARIYTTNLCNKHKGQGSNKKRYSRI